MPAPFAGQGFCASTAVTAQHRAKLMRQICLLLFLASFGVFCYHLRPDQPKLFLTRVNQLSIEVEPRMLDWNWRDTEEEQRCRHPERHTLAVKPIPHVVHYILLADAGTQAEISFRAFLSIKATLIRVRPDAIKLHTNVLNTSNPWWRLLRDRVELVHHDLSALHTPHGLNINSLLLAHQADILRLAILQEEGGIYLDTDVIPLKPFTDLLYSPRDVVMGHEGGNRYGLCNAIILARPDSEFLERWIASYATFQPSVWNYHSVRMPKLLQVQFPELICPLSPTVFFWPTWAAEHRRMMDDPIDDQQVQQFERNLTLYDGAMYENQLAVHLRIDIDEQSVRTKVTRYNLLIRDLLDTPLPSLQETHVRRRSQS